MTDALQVRLSWEVRHTFELDPLALIEAFPEEWEQAAEQAEAEGYQRWERFTVFLNGFIDNCPAEVFASQPGVTVCWEDDTDIDFRWRPSHAAELTEALEAKRIAALPPPQDTTLPLETL